MRCAPPSALASRLKKGDIADVVVLFGDAPMLRPKLTRPCSAERRRASPRPSSRPGAPADPGLRSALCSIRWRARASSGRATRPPERQIGLCNGGIMAIDSRHLFVWSTGSATTTPSADST
jgi:bifunctional UDP-N-acetylglucosamine pyrophosphorylase/glucosamine-1-phosphate N-acetyltransferase